MFSFFFLKKDIFNSMVDTVTNNVLDIRKMSGRLIKTFLA